MTWNEHLDWLNGLPKGEFYTYRWLYQTWGHAKYRRIWEKRWLK